MGIQRKRRDPWPRITVLQASLPVLERAPKPFHPEKLYRWARKASTRERHMARFVLDVFNPAFIDDLLDREFGHFQLVDACAGLDGIHRKVISDWVANPWWG